MRAIVNRANNNLISTKIYNKKTSLKLYTELINKQTERKKPCHGLTL